MNLESNRVDPPGTNRGIRGLLTLLCGATILLTVALGSSDIWNPNEPIYCRAVVEMSERGDWLTPTVNGTLFAEKPVLYYWMALTASRVTGSVGEFILRLPSVAAGLLGIILTYFLVLPCIGRKRAFIEAYGIWDWRAEYSFRGEQNIRVINDLSILEYFWSGAPPRLLLVEDGRLGGVVHMTGDEPASQRALGSRIVYLFSDHALATK